jgi:SAM-dependent methyltransferase
MAHRHRDGYTAYGRPLDTKFVCNLCGQENTLEAAHLLNPELVSCSRCGSNIRLRWLAKRLSSELFGSSLPLFEFPRMPFLKGLGLTDPDVLAHQLTKSFTYRNTYYDSEPRFDICSDDSPLGELDFLIASEVLEHVEPPVTRAFRNAARLLKPSGIFLLTAPWVWDGSRENALPELYDWKLCSEGERWVIVNRNPAGEVERFYDLAFDDKPGPCLGNTREHFPELYDWKLLEHDGIRTLENRRRDGSMQRFEHLVFHSGPGLALEMRLFTKRALERELLAAGFRSVQFEAEECPASGIVFPYPWSRPIVARH